MAVTALGEGREFELIRSFLAHARKDEHPLLSVGSGDDCAIIPPFAISSDMSIENVHFRRAWLQPTEIGYRAATAALSDLAAVAAEPVAALVSFAFSSDDASEWATTVMKGAIEGIEAHGAVLAGGDVTRMEGAAALDVIVIGKVDKPVLRSGARAGDEIWTTGQLGGAAAAVAAWQDGRTPDIRARARYARPAARIREALWLRERVELHAMIDLSDGIAGDSRHIAAASRCRLILDAALIPIHPSADLKLALQGGEDYELCFAASAGTIEPIHADFETSFGVTLTRIGDVAPGHGVEFLNAPELPGFDHFRAKAE